MVGSTTTQSWCCEMRDAVQVNQPSSLYVVAFLPPPPPPPPPPPGRPSARRESKEDSPCRTHHDSNFGKGQKTIILR